MSIQAALRRDEGYRIWPYSDSRGNLTWGIGHNLTAAPLCQEAADLLGQAIQAQFQHDLDGVNAALQAYCWAAKLDPVRLAAIQNMVFNLGARTFGGFGQFLEYMENGEYTRAAADLRTTLVYKQLPERYERIAKEIETGVEQ